MTKKPKPSDKVQLPLFIPESSWRPPELSSLPDDWNAAPRLSIDVETKDPQVKELGIGVRRPGCYMIGYSVALEGGPSFYVPFRHNGGDNVDEGGALRYLRHQVKNYRGSVVGANIQYDLDYLLEEGADFVDAAWIRDIQIADPLIHELHDSYSLKSIAERHGIAGKDETKLREAASAYGLDPKSGMWQLPARFVGAYAEQDVRSPLEIIARQERIIETMELQRIYDLESRVTPVLVRMRRRGVRIDQDRLQRIEDWSIAQEGEALTFVNRETGSSLRVGDVWDAKALAAPLRSLGFNVPLTSQGRDSIDKDLLSTLKHPVADALARARKVNKLRTTFANSIRRYMINGRVHCTFNQMARETETGDMRGARYGRLSCTDPNMQQQPSRDEFAKEWRSIYLPEEGRLWCSADYSQQEPRWTTHFAAIYPFQDEAIRLSAQRAAAKYRDDPTTDNHDLMTRIVYGDEVVNAMTPPQFKKSRTGCKIIYLGLCYGEGGGKLCEDLGLPVRWAVAYRESRDRKVEYFETHWDAESFASEKPGSFCWKAAGLEGQEILDKFNGSAPHIQALAKEASRLANRGYIITGGGRRLNFQKGSDNRYMYTHKSLNRVIQGTSADQTKAALVEIDRAGHFLQLQVHDEITGSVASEIEARAIGDIMQNCMEAEVPFKVDIETGPSWGESMG